MILSLVCITLYIVVFVSLWIALEKKHMFSVIFAAAFPLQVLRPFFSVPEAVDNLAAQIMRPLCRHDSVALVVDLVGKYAYFVHYTAFAAVALLSIFFAAQSIAVFITRYYPVSVTYGKLIRGNSASDSFKSYDRKSNFIFVKQDLTFNS